MKKFFIIFSIFLVSLALVESVQGQFKSKLLDDVGSSFASRPISVFCRNIDEDSILFGAWGYVLKPTSTSKYTVIRDSACVGALAIDLDVSEISDFYKVIGAAVLVHEAYHLKRIKFNENEAHTECRAMKHYDIVLFKLGAEEETVKRLLPKMMVNYYEHLILAPHYGLKNCTIPNRYNEYLTHLEPSSP